MEKKRISFLGKILLLAIILPFVFLLALLWGGVSISVRESLLILGSRLPGISSFIDISQIKESYQTIVLELRLPRALLSFLTGMGLGVAGCVYQGIFSNPMADPYLLGVSSGSAFGATIAMLLPLSGLLSPLLFRSLFAFFGAMGALFLVFFLSSNRFFFGKSASKARLDGNVTLILAGIALNYLLSSLIAFLMIFNRKKLESVYFWTLGSFKNARWPEIILAGAVVAVVFFVLFIQSRELDMIMADEEQARTLGVAVDKVKRRVLVFSSFMVAVLISLCGIIGFVGLVVPHITRFLTGPKHRMSLPFSAVFGGMFLMLCDTVSRSTFSHIEISVGIITSFLGVPFFLWLIQKSRRKEVSG